MCIRDRTRTICVHDREDIVLFFSEKAETHRIKIVKLTENFRTALGISAFTAEGTLNIFQRESHEVIEFIGDSITCGFGNSASDVSHEFEASEENGWLTHGAIAARALELEPRFVSVSGISVAKSSAMPNLYGMNELYQMCIRDSAGTVFYPGTLRICQLLPLLTSPAFRNRIQTCRISARLYSTSVFFSCRYFYIKNMQNIRIF